jgi:hypothetical protein
MATNMHALRLACANCQDDLLIEHAPQALWHDVALKCRVLPEWRHGLSSQLPLSLAGLLTGGVPPQPCRAVDDDEAWRRQSARDQIVEQTPPGRLALALVARAAEGLVQLRCHQVLDEHAHTLRDRCLDRIEPAGAQQSR